MFVDDVDDVVSISLDLTPIYVLSPMCYESMKYDLVLELPASIKDRFLLTQLVL